MNATAKNILEKLVVAAILALCGWTYHFVTGTDHRLWVLEWRVNQAIGPPSWEDKGGAAHAREDH
jgi:hypothetical protein